MKAATDFGLAFEFSFLSSMDMYTYVCVQCMMQMCHMRVTRNACIQISDFDAQPKISTTYITFYYCTQLQVHSYIAFTYLKL